LFSQEKGDATATTAHTSSANNRSRNNLLSGHPTPREGGRDNNQPRSGGGFSNHGNNGAASHNSTSSDGRARSATTPSSQSGANSTRHNRGDHSGVYKIRSESLGFQNSPNLTTSHYMNAHKRQSQGVVGGISGTQPLSSGSNQKGRDTAGGYQCSDPSELTRFFFLNRTQLLVKK